MSTARLSARELQSLRNMGGLAEQAADEIMALRANEALPWPCTCDERGIGAPGASCGDCPRDYMHQAPAPAPEPIGYADAESLKWLADPARYPGAKISTTLHKQATEGADIAVYVATAPVAGEQAAAQYIALTEAMGYEAGASMLSPEEFAADLRARAAQAPAVGADHTALLQQALDAMLPAMGAWAGTCAWHGPLRKAIAAVREALGESKPLAQQMGEQP